MITSERVLDLGRLGLLNGPLERAHSIRGLRQQPVHDALAEVAQGLPARQSIANEPNEFRALKKLVVIGRVRGLDIGKVKHTDVIGSEPAL